MPFTVRQLLSSPEFAGVELISGSSGLDNVITSVNVMEAPDIAQWLRGGELLLSTGYQFRDHPEEFGDLVLSVQQVGAAAIGFKNRFLHHFPNQARDLAEWLGLPILGLPPELPYSDIIRFVILKTDEVENIRLSETILRSFSQIIAEGGNAGKILQNLMFFTKTSVCFLDAVTGRRVCAPDTDSFEGIPDDNLDTLLRKYPYERLDLAGSTYGYFIFDQYPSDPLGQVVVEHAKTAILLAMQREIATRQVESRYRDEFVLDLLTGSARQHEEIKSRAARFGWDLSGPLCTVVISLDGYRYYYEQPFSEKLTRDIEETRVRIYSICVGEMRQVFGECPYSTMSDSIVFLLSTGRRGSIRQRISLCARNIEARLASWTHVTVTAGVGEEKPDFSGIAESYDEARNAIELMRPLGGAGELHFWEDLGIFTVLSSVCRTEEARKFCQTRLGGILDSPERNKELFFTLETLIAENWNFKTVAATLNIHYNTVRYRFERMSEMLGRDLSRSETRLEVALALKLLQLNPSLLS